MTLPSFTKQPAETFPIGFEYYGLTPFGATPVSAVISAWNETDDTDASDVVLESTTGLVVGTMVRAGVTQGTSGKTYKITCRATLSDGSVLESDRTMIVTEV